MLKINPGYRLFYKHLHSTLGERNLKLTSEKPGCKLLAARTKLGKVPKWTYMFAGSLLRTADWKLSNCGKSKKDSLIWHVVLKGKFHFRVRITRRSIKMWNRKIFCCVPFVKGTYFTRVVLVKIATKLTRKKFKILNWYFGLDIKKKKERKKERKRLFQTHLPD